MRIHPGSTLAFSLALVACHGQVGHRAGPSRSGMPDARVPPDASIPLADSPACSPRGPEACGNGVDDDCDPATTDTCPRSCAEILARDGTAADGVYDVALLGTVMRVHCDMTRDGGGWTLAMNTPTSGYESLPTVWDQLDLETRGRLPPAALYELFDASTEEGNNVRVRVGDAWHVSMHVELPDGAVLPDGWSPNTPVQAYACRVPTSANGDCSGFDPGPDVATCVPSDVWQFANGSDGGSVGYSEHGSRHGEQALFHINFDTAIDTACSRPRTDGAWQPGQPGAMWIR